MGRHPVRAAKCGQSLALSACYVELDRLVVLLFLLTREFFV